MGSIIGSRESIPALTGTHDSSEFLVRTASASRQCVSEFCCVTRKLAGGDEYRALSATMLQTIIQ